MLAKEEIYGEKDEEIKRNIKVKNKGVVITETQQITEKMKILREGRA